MKGVWAPGGSAAERIESKTRFLFPLQDFSLSLAPGGLGQEGSAGGYEEKLTASATHGDKTTLMVVRFLVMPVKHLSKGGLTRGGQRVINLLSLYFRVT